MKNIIKTFVLFVLLSGKVYAADSTMTEGMKLFYTPGACSLASRIVANELTLGIQYESVDLKTHVTSLGTNYYKINDKGSVPALGLKSGDVLTENAVIMQYLADSDISGRLLPKVGDFQRYRVLEAVNYISTELHKGIAPAFNPDLPSNIKSSMMVSVKSKLDYLDKKLKDKDFIVGDKFTIADAYLFTVLRWLPYADMDIKSWKNLDHYSKKMAKRKSIKMSLEQEGLK